MTPLYAIHLFIVAVIFSIPLWPLRLLKYGVFIPSALALVWLVFNGCPISFAQPELEGKSEFTYDVFKRVVPGITKQQTDHFLTAYLIIATLVSSMRLWK